MDWQDRPSSVQHQTYKSSRTRCWKIVHNENQPYYYRAGKVSHCGHATYQQGLLGQTTPTVIPQKPVK